MSGAGVEHQRFALLKTDAATGHGHDTVRRALPTERLRLKVDRADVLTESATHIVAHAHLPRRSPGCVATAPSPTGWSPPPSTRQTPRDTPRSSDDDTVLIEVTPGDITALLHGSVDVTTLVCRRDGSVISDTRQLFYEIPVYDAHLDGLRHVDVVPFRIELSPAVRGRIIGLLTALEHRYRRCRLEWMLCGEHLVLYDLSLETSELPVIRVGAASDAIVVSPGAARGVVLNLDEDDLHRLRTSISGRVSVVPDAAELSALSEPVTARAREELLGRVHGTPVVCAPYPDIALALLLDHASGFVFRGGCRAEPLRHHLEASRSSRTDRPGRRRHGRRTPIQFGCP